MIDVFVKTSQVVEDERVILIVRKQFYIGMVKKFIIIK
jgi:hypothetical protein